MKTFKPGDIVLANFQSYGTVNVSDKHGAHFAVNNGDRGKVVNDITPAYNDSTCYVLFDKHPESPVWLFYKSLRGLELECLRGPAITLEIT